MIAQIRDLPTKLAQLMQNLSDERRQNLCAEGEWTIQQIVHHLADCHMNDFVRLKSMLTQDNPTLPPFDPEAWSTLSDATSPPLQTSLAILSGLHLRWSALLESLSEAEWQRSAIHPLWGSVTVATLLGTYAGHGEEHLAQISRFELFTFLEG